MIELAACFYVVKCVLEVVIALINMCRKEK